MVWSDGYQLQSRDYRIARVLGQGGFGITYQARHLKLDQDFVIKTPNEHLKFDPDYPKFVDRFIKEGQRIAKLCTNPHPHIVRVFDLFQEGDTHCMVMDFIPGESLWQRVQGRGALPEVEAVTYFQQIGGALQRVHEAGLVHRDAHPGNIMFRGDEAVLIDFGIAGEIVPVTISYKPFGNEAFAPLEQRKGFREPTVDIYTLSASLYYALTGERPASSFDRKIDDVELVPPKQLVRSLSDTVNKAVLKGMELKPQDRPQTMGEWLSVLQPPIPTTTVSPGYQKLDRTRVSPGYQKLDRTRVSPHYEKLQQFLAAGKWREADEETARVMLLVAGREEEGWLDENSINQFPCEDLRRIDGLWVQYSNGRFGFSVQKRIWQECGGKVDYETKCRLGDRVGWRRRDKWLEYHELTFSTMTPPGHLPLGLGTGWGVWEVWNTSSLVARLINCNL
ncbi:serine/threonine-protein kinase [Oscillatoria acuminata]|uniref:Serine/threonine protein kinase n=1 Tax=Oscillatoria acuminata PCC 6304 TaxID=56110 RepID=K9TKT5_9CYAN|nr:serine/threonine-protein kinase [Oscillatoria acuminata]AFY83467.1 serine/threonine protein kinase [Oscillatoria acuminata PCC 6304]